LIEITAQNEKSISKINTAIKEESSKSRICGSDWDPNKIKEERGTSSLAACRELTLVLMGQEEVGQTPKIDSLRERERENVFLLRGLTKEIH